MEKSIPCIILILVLLGFFLQPISAEQVISINTLIEEAKKMDGQTVSVQGEAIGEPMNRGEYTWVNVHDGSNAIGLWIKKEDAKRLSFYGDYRHQGDQVIVEGVFNRACTEHGGEADFHVISLNIVNKGHEIEEVVSINKIFSVVIIGTFLTILAALFYKKVKQ